MSIESWPFLVSRNLHLDYRTVVAPDFICKEKISNLLARVADGDLTEPSNGFIRQISGSNAGDFTIVFRVIKATEKDLNNERGNEIVKDSFGREIYLVEGVVVKGIRSKKDFFVTNQELEKVHKLLMEKYSKFWEYTEAPPAISLPKFSLSMDKSSSPLQLEELPPFQVKSNAPKPPPPFPVKLVAVLFGIIVVLALAIWFSPIKNLFGKNILSECTTSQEEEIVFNPNNKVDSIISDKQKQWQTDYPKAAIFLSGSLPVKSSNEFQSLDKRTQPVNAKIKYTIWLIKDRNSLEMQDHPLDLAIAQLHNQEVVEKATITAKIIDQKECPN